LRPNIVMIDTKGEVHLIRKQETVNTIVDCEIVPEHLKKFVI